MLSAIDLNTSAASIAAEDALPAWWFDVDDEDDVETQASLLQELDIDLTLIYRSAAWMLLGPLGYHYGRFAEAHPLSSMLQPRALPPSSSSASTTSIRLSQQSLPDALSQRSASGGSGYSYNHSNPSSSFALSASPSPYPRSPPTNAHPHIDFWGPCLVVSLYGALLWLARVRDVPFLYVIWSLASLLNHFVCRVFFKPSKLLAHFTLLGYSVTPIVPVAAVIVLFRPPVWACTALEAAAVAWASAAAASSYLVVFKAAAVNDDKRRLLLVLPVVVLMETYIISLLPVRRY